MARSIRLGAIAMTAVLLLAGVAPAVAAQPADISVSVGNSDYTVTVTHNGSPVNGSNVTVTPTDPNATYAGASGVTDANGTVTFDLPENETDVNITATVDGTETTIAYTLPGAGQPTWDGEGPFGRWLSSIIQNLVPPDSGEPLGQLVSDIVTANNPGSEHRSERANPGGNESDGGPPAHAGNGDDDGGDDERGPPDHAKGGDDEGDDEDELNVTVDGDLEANATVTVTVTHNGSSVENATVKLNGAVVGTTDADGQLAVTLPAELGDELEIEVETEDAEGEWEHEFEDAEEEEDDEGNGEDEGNNGQGNGR